jgi:hypothetical protein
MHLKNIPPALVPFKHTAELEALSKAALMDMIWSLAAQLSECCDDERQVMYTIGREWKTVERYRKEFKKRCDEIIAENPKIKAILITEQGGSDTDGFQSPTNFTDTSGSR